MSKRTNSLESQSRKKWDFRESAENADAEQSGKSQAGDTGCIEKLRMFLLDGSYMLYEMGELLCSA